MNTRKIKFGAAGLGGTYRVFGDTFANLVTSKNKKYSMEVKTTAGSAANLRLLSDGYIQMAIAQMDLTNDAYERTGIFENEKKSPTELANLTAEPKKFSEKSARIHAARKKRGRE